MYEYLFGVIAKATPAFLVVDVSGVGYKVFTSLRSFEMAEVGMEAKIYTHHHVTESSMAMYGFLSDTERDFFRVLISVSGVGPSTALMLLTIGVDDLMDAIAREDAAFISKAKGVGPKTAKQIILDLKPKIEAKPKSSEAPKPVSADAEDAIAGLVALGYTATKAKDAVGKVEQYDSVGDLIRKSLKILS